MHAKQTLWSASLVVVLVGRAVIAHADPANADEPVESEVRPPTGRFEIGAGFSSIEGFIARARVAQDSLFGTGHALSLDASVSARRHRFAIDYATPDLGGGLTLHASLVAEKRLIPGWWREGNGASITLMRRLAPHTYVFSGLRLEEVAVTPAGWAPRGELGQRTDGTIVSLRSGFIYDSRDRADAPTSGTHLGISGESAAPMLGSDFSFVRLSAWGSHHRQLGPFILHAGGRYTQLTGDVPIAEQLYIDGQNDIRGYSFGAFGTGTTKWTARGELELPLFKRIGLSAVGFVDAGGIGNGTTGTFGASAGVGLLWRSPIGPLRFDWAVPLDGGAPRFVFGFGGSW